MRTVRVTVDMPENEHMYLKMACAKLKLSLKDFIIQATEQKIQEVEDEWLALQVDEVKERVKNGEETFTSWEKVKERLNLNDL